MSFKKGALVFKSYSRAESGFTLTKLLQVLLSPLLVLINYPFWKQRNPFLKQQIISLGEIVGCYDNISLEGLIKNDRGYKWSSLLADIDEYGVQFMISVRSSDSQVLHGYIMEGNEKINDPTLAKKYEKWPYHVVDGNHRIRILKSLYPSNTKIKVKIYETNRKIHSN